MRNYLTKWLQRLEAEKTLPLVCSTYVPGVGITEVREIARRVR